MSFTVNSKNEYCLLLEVFCPLWYVGQRWAVRGYEISFVRPSVIAMSPKCSVIKSYIKISSKILPVLCSNNLTSIFLLSNFLPLLIPHVSFQNHSPDILSHKSLLDSTLYLTRYIPLLLDRYLEIIGHKLDYMFRLLTFSSLL